MIKHESRAYFRALGAHISKLRKEQGMTQAELARDLGVSQQTVFAYEIGERRVSVLILAKLAKIFAIHVEGHDDVAATDRAPPVTRRYSPCPALSGTEQNGATLREENYRRLARALNAMSTLNRDIATYNRHLPELLGQQGKFVLIKGDEVAGTFDSYQDALTAGYQRFKLDSFLVKQISATERVAYFSRDLNPSCRA